MRISTRKNLGEEAPTHPRRGPSTSHSLNRHQLLSAVKRSLDEILSRPWLIFSCLGSAASGRASLSLINNVRNLRIEWRFTLCLMQLDREGQALEEGNGHEDLQKYNNISNNHGTLPCTTVPSALHAVPNDQADQ